MLSVPLARTLRAPTSWRNRIVRHGDVPPAELLENPANWRVHPKHQRDALAGSLDTVGWVAQVMVNERTGFVVDGHARVALAIGRKEPLVPVAFVDLDPDEEALVLATLDPIGAMATRDEAQLRALLEGIATEDAGLRALLEDLAGPATTSGLTEPDDAPPPVAEPYVQPGDLWALGRHRLLVGDATVAADVGRVLDGQRPSMTVTDPPYGVEYDASWRRKLAGGGKFREGKVRNDDRADWSAAMALLPGDVAYVWHGGLHAGVVADSLAAAGFEIRSQIIWTKPTLVMSRGHYHWQHEPCWYAVRSGANAGWKGDRRQATVWQAAAVHRTAGTSDDLITNHSTQKPVEVVLRALRNHRGDVFDPFLGSGTTLIAAEQEGRRCFAIEIEPAWAQVTIERWQAFTGQPATRL